MDLNSDLADGFGRWELGDDEALLSIVNSANVACGFHAGDSSVIRRAVERAAARGVAVGAQTSYRDLAGFGRRFIDVPPAELTVDVIYQIGAVAGFEQAAAVVDAVRAFDPSLAVLGLPGSQWLQQAERAGLAVFREAFADRAYTPQGTLVSRREPGAVLHDPDEIAERCLRFAAGEPIRAIDGSEIRVEADSICVHGDSPGAVAIAAAVRDRLAAEGVRLAPFAPGTR